jgi:hypothetical protein
MIFGLANIWALLGLLLYLLLRMFMGEKPNHAVLPS